MLNSVFGTHLSTFAKSKCSLRENIRWMLAPQVHRVGINPP